MFSFAYSYVLFLLLLVPVILCIYLLARRVRMKRLRTFGNINELKALMPEVSPYKPPIKITLACVAVAALVIALARPWGGVKDQKTIKQGIEVVIAVDASNSMLASATSDPDGAPRMRTAKLILEKLIGKLDNDRVGLIVYAGDAYTLIPVTSDYVSARMFLNSIDPSLISNQGTNIAAAIQASLNSFSGKKKVGRAIVLITDAEDLEDIDGALQAAKSAQSAGVQLDVIGIGTSTPVPIPASAGTFINDDGTPAATALNEDLGASIAKAGKGIYVNASNPDALDELTKQLSTVKKSALESSFLAVHDELFFIFLWIALAALVIDVFVLDTKIPWLDRINFFKKEN